MTDIAVRKGGFRTLAKQLLVGFVLCASVAAGGLTWVTSSRAAVSPSNIIAYEGRLLNSNGVPVSDTSVSMIFELYTAVSGGTCLWSNSSATCASATARTVTLTDALFSENLGDTAAGTPYPAIADTVFGDDESVFLQITVAGEVLSPRKQIVAAPYAINTSLLDGLNSTQAGGTSALVLALDTSGNLQLTGSPQGTGVSQGSVYINPATGVVAANEIILGVAVSGTSRFSVDGEGDSVLLGDLAITGGDLTSGATSFNLLNSTVTTLTMAGAATTLDINNAAVTSAINIGGTSADGANTVSIATNSTTADTITVGNANAGTLVAITGGDDWSITSGGLFTTAGNVAVNGGGISSTAALAITSSGGNISLGPNGAPGLVYVTASDDFAVGATSLTAPFSVDESLNTVRIGDATSDSNDPTITFYASDASDSGSITYLDTDRFNFTGGNFTFTGNGTLPTAADTIEVEHLASSTYTGTSSASLNIVEMYTTGANATYSAIEHATGTDHYVGAENNSLTISGATATMSRGFASRNRLTNTSTNASLVAVPGYLVAVEGDFSQNAAATTLATAYGVHGMVSSTLGTVTSGIGVFGEIASGIGTITTGYAGQFVATSGGTNRYGVYAEASGGTANYSGYFTGSAVQIDANSTPDTPNYATAAGELFVSGDIENDGSTAFGDTSGTDQMLITSGVTTTDAITITTAGLTSGSGLVMTRAAGGADFDGVLMSLNQLNVSATSDATVLGIANSGAGNSNALKLTQNTVAAHSGTATTNSAFVIDVNERDTDGADNDVFVIRSDADNSSADLDMEFRVELDGEVFADGALVGTGADYAEYFLSQDAGLGGGELVCQDTLMAQAVKTCGAGDGSVMGVISTNAAFIGNNIPGASGNLGTDTRYRLVGMVGQIETLVNAGEGAIAIGDAITSSAVMTGYGAKLAGPARIVGFALEALPSGTGTIRVLVQPQWYGGEVFSATGSVTNVATDVVMAPLGVATSGTPGVNSHELSLRGSAWTGSAAASRAMTIATSVSTADDYRLVVRDNDGTEAAYISNEGDLALAGRLYPSDRGALQHNRYIYYDGSTGGAGDFMRTNASGWATGSYDFAEMFPSPDRLAPGEVVVFGDTNAAVKRSLGETYAQGIAGIVSTRPGFLAGENTAGSYPIALAGRVPTYVSGENGAIAIGDPLTTSSKAGYAMKATEAGPIIGYATEPFTGTVGSIVVYVNVSYFDGDPSNDAPAANNAVSTLATPASLFDASGALNVSGGSMLSIGSMHGIGGNWHLEENGDFVTHGRVVQLVESFQGDDVETYAAATRQMTIELSGTATIKNGIAVIDFDDIDPQFNDIISPTSPYRVLLTPYAATGTLYVAQRSAKGFMIQEHGSSDGVLVDWLVIAPHKDYEPVVVDEVESSVEAIIEEAVDVEVPETVVDEPELEVVDDVIDEPVADESLGDPLLPKEGQGEVASHLSTEAAPDVTIAEPVVVEPEPTE